MKRRIIDKRKKEKYMLDDEYLNGMARLCGWQATIVYNSLCRHSDAEQKCFPSIKLMCEQHNVSRPTILKGLKNLEDRRVIEIKKMRSKSGKWLNNVYYLNDKSEWIYNQVNDIDTVNHVNENTPPSQRRLHDQVNVVDTKETHREGNTYKDSVANATRSFSLVEEIEKLEENKRRDLNIIALYLRERNVKLENHEQLQSTIKRHLRPAKQLSPFSNDQILKACKTAKNEYKDIWTIETLVKLVTK